MDEFENDNLPPVKIGDERHIHYLFKTLRTNINRIDKDLNHIDFVIAELEDRKRVLSDRKDYEKSKLDELEACFTSFAEKLTAKAESVIRTVTYPLKKENRALKKEVERLTKLVGDQAQTFDSIELEAIAKAKSIAIIEGILFAIEEWSDTDVPAADVTLVSQSIVFKTVHEKIMKGDTDYYFDEVPHTAYEVVKRGREYVKHFREVSPVAITEPSMWSAHAHELQKWWVNDGLVLLYGARDDAWASTEPYELEDMLKWRSTDLDKTTSFPYVFDAIELTRKYGDEIRESSGLPEFTRNTMQTRLTTHE